MQTDVVVTDKNDQAIADLTVDDFKLTENGKRQEIKFAQFVSADQAPRLEGSVNVAGRPIDPEVARNLSAKDLRRVFAFVIDDLTIPYEDVSNLRKLLNDFVDDKMREGDLVAIIRVTGGKGLLQQFTSDRQLLRRAIAEITPTMNAYSAFHNLDPVAGINTRPAQGPESNAPLSFPASSRDADVDSSAEGVTGRAIRGLDRRRRSRHEIAAWAKESVRSQAGCRWEGIAESGQIRRPTNVRNPQHVLERSYAASTDRPRQPRCSHQHFEQRSQGGGRAYPALPIRERGRSGLLPNAGGEPSDARLT